MDIIRGLSQSYEVFTLESLRTFIEDADMLKISGTPTVRTNERGNIIEIKVDNSEDDKNDI